MIKTDRQSSKTGLRGITLVVLLFLTFPILSAPKILLNKEVGITTLDSAYLSQIFAMQVRKWPNGLAIQVFILPSESELHREFVINKLKIQAHQLDRIWNRMLFTGTGKAPSVVDTQAEMIEMIKKTPGAIGYTSEDFPTNGTVALEGAE